MRKRKRINVSIEELLNGARKSNNSILQKTIKKMVRGGYKPKKETVTDILDRKYERIIWVKPKASA